MPMTKLQDGEVDGGVITAVAGDGDYIGEDGKAFTVLLQNHIFVRIPVHYYPILFVPRLRRLHRWHCQQYFGGFLRLCGCRRIG